MAAARHRGTLHGVACSRALARRRGAVRARPVRATRWRSVSEFCAGSRLGGDFEWAPVVQRTAGAEVDAEVVALMRLVPSPFNRNARQIAEPQRADAAVPDHGDVAGLIVDEQILEGGGDSPLRVDRSLPTPCADRRSAKQASAQASCSSGGRKPVAERSISPVSARISMGTPRRPASTDAVCRALVSALHTIRPTVWTHCAASNRPRRARPRSLRTQRSTATAASTITSGCVMYRATATSAASRERAHHRHR